MANLAAEAIRGVAKPSEFPLCRPRARLTAVNWADTGKQTVKRASAERVDRLGGPDRPGGLAGRLRVQLSQSGDGAAPA